MSQVKVTEVGHVTSDGETGRRGVHGIHSMVLGSEPVVRPPDQREKRHPIRVRSDLSEVRRLEPRGSPVHTLSEDTTVDQVPVLTVVVEDGRVERVRDQDTVLDVPACCCDGRGPRVVIQGGKEESLIRLRSLGVPPTVLWSLPQRDPPRLFLRFSTTTT